jgi:hypothetical protein
MWAITLLQQLQLVLLLEHNNKNQSAYDLRYPHTTATQRTLVLTKWKMMKVLAILAQLQDNSRTVTLQLSLHSEQLFSANNQVSAEMVTCDGEIQRMVFTSDPAEGSKWKVIISISMHWVEMPPNKQPL